MKKGILPILLGLAAAIASSFIVESIGHICYPTNTPPDMHNKEAMQTFIDSLPLGALLFILVAWLIGGFCGGIVTTLLDPSNGQRNSLIIGAVVLFFGIMTMLMIPHPTWMWVFACLTIIPMSVLGNKIILLNKKIS